MMIDKVYFCAHVLSPGRWLVGGGVSLVVNFLRLTRYIPVECSRGPVMVAAVGCTICILSPSNQQRYLASQNWYAKSNERYTKSGKRCDSLAVWGMFVDGRRAAHDDDMVTPLGVPAMIVGAE